MISPAASSLTEPELVKMFSRNTDEDFSAIVRLSAVRSETRGGGVLRGKAHGDGAAEEGAVPGGYEGYGGGHYSSHP